MLNIRTLGTLLFQITRPELISKWRLQDTNRFSVTRLYYFDCIHQHCFKRILKPSGQLSGKGSCKLLLPTPQIIAEESTSLQGISPVSISQRTTPNDLEERVKGNGDEKQGLWYGQIHQPIIYHSPHSIIINSLMLTQSCSEREVTKMHTIYPLSQKLVHFL